MLRDKENVEKTITCFDLLKKEENEAEQETEKK